MVLKNINLNAWSKNKNLAPIVVAQGDVKSDIIEITLVDDNGQPINLTDITPRVHFAKPDKTIVYIDADIISAIGGRISVTLTSQSTAVPGMVYATVQLISNSEPTLYIKGLRLQVTPNSVEGSVESSNEFTALTEALSTVQQYDGRIATNTADIAELQTDKADKSEVEDLDANKADKSELGIRKKVLWNGSLTSNDTTVTLSDDLSNYAMILVVGRANQWGHYPVGVMMPINTIDGAGWHIGADLNNKLILSTSAELIFQFPESKSLKSITGFSEVNQLSTVYGLL